MKLLLDTHAFIWAASDPKRLSERAKIAISDPNHDVYVSAVSGWEIAIKRGRGRLIFPNVDRAMLTELRFIELPITLRHSAELAALPDHHRDPFDRMLIAQARSEKLTLVSLDPALQAYEIDLYW